MPKSTIAESYVKYMISFKETTKLCFEVTVLFYTYLCLKHMLNKKNSFVIQY